MHSPNIDPFTDRELERADMFIDEARALYPSEAHRITGTRQLSTILTSMELFLTTGPKGLVSFKPDGVVMAQTKQADATPTPGFHPVSMVTETKWEFGKSSSDPAAQAECVYIAIYTSDEAAPFREVCCCPTILIAYGGPNIQVLGAVFADNIIIYPLTDYISVIPRGAMPAGSHHASTALSEHASYYRIARLLRGLLFVRSYLETYYQDVFNKMPEALRTELQSAPRGPPKAKGKLGKARVSPSKFVGPYFECFTDVEGRQVTLTYTGRLRADEYRDKALFLAQATVAPAGSTDQSSTFSKSFTVVVKFTFQYGEEGHKLLEPEHAPKLWYCARANDTSMWIVVMDFIQGKDVNEDRSLTRVQGKDLRKALSRLHEVDLVFGDVCAANIITVGHTIRLVDFDWCDKVNKAHYPPNLPIRTMGYHRDAIRGGLIKKEHDIHMYGKLTMTDTSKLKTL
ncbi:uncharacterized protein BXZ73DRAFT_105465 [Epithele typhae]|uniref:uncharacterized protein n=1 Tax=Epithele typhae TaxID=378194 RepID=UPI002008650D|nr:uncharacterized protein BXZ73DRAFT_105465 [Epithele typhae]KAH9917641.1 hypothetical protein BXZ73DRAFT_105465 [Epithele typhae]